MNSYSKLAYPDDTNTNTNTNIIKILPYKEYLNKIIITFPIYYNVFKKYYSDGTDVSYELNRLYQPIFIGLVEYYSEFMGGSGYDCEDGSGIEQIITKVKNKYNPDLPYAIIDYLEFLFGNVLYETFLTEIKKISNELLTYEYLCVFEYIIRVELHKHKIYQEILDNLKQSEKSNNPDNIESKLTTVFECRINKCLKKITFSLGLLEKYSLSHTHTNTRINIVDHCKKIISDYNCDLLSLIDTNITSNINSFMEIKNYN